MKKTLMIISLVVYNKLFSNNKSNFIKIIR